LLGFPFHDGYLGWSKRGGANGVEFGKRSLGDLGQIIVGDARYHKRRSSYYITMLFEEAGLPYQHDGSTRSIWASDRVKDILETYPTAPNQLPPEFIRLLRLVMDKEDVQSEDDPDRALALEVLNKPLRRHDFEAYWATDGLLYVRHQPTNTSSANPNPHKPFSAMELQRKKQLEEYLNQCSEDDLLEEVLYPLFRQIGYHRVTLAGHKDKNLEHGKDAWMRFQLPSQQMLYFGIQAKKGKLDASADSTKTNGPNTNIAVIYNQALMMLNSVIMDQEFGREVLVDHCFIIAGGEITKSARLWLGRNLEASKRSQVMFMDREDILNLFVVSNTQLPEGALPPEKKGGWLDEIDDDVPF
jgi:hypothetical protein